MRNRTPWLAILAAFVLGLLARGWPPSARADSPWTGAAVLNTGGVVSSNAATATRLIGTSSTAATRIYLNGLVANNVDSAAHTFTLLSHVSGRVMWQATIPANSGLILDSVQLLATDASVTTATVYHNEELAFSSDTTAGNKIGVTATGYEK